MTSSIDLLERQRCKLLNQLCRVANQIKAVDIKIARIEGENEERKEPN